MCKFGLVSPDFEICFRSRRQVSARRSASWCLRADVVSTHSDRNHAGEHYLPMLLSTTVMFMDVPSMFFAACGTPAFNNSISSLIARDTHSRLFCGRPHLTSRMSKEDGQPGPQLTHFEKQQLRLFRVIARSSNLRHESRMFPGLVNMNAFCRESCAFRKSPEEWGGGNASSSAEVGDRGLRLPCAMLLIATPFKEVTVPATSTPGSAKYSCLEECSSCFFSIASLKNPWVARGG